MYPAASFILAYRVQWPKASRGTAVGRGGGWKMRKSEAGSPGSIKGEPRTGRKYYKATLGCNASVGTKNEDTPSSPLL